MSIEPSSGSAGSPSGGEAACPEGGDCRVIRKLGGRHLIFRAHPGPFKFLPRPGILISPFQGPVWFFYGMGQVWLTHRKSETYSGWRSRVPRVGAGKLAALVSQLRPELETFIDFCNEHGIEGTLLFESRVVEFHWVFGFELEEEKGKPEHADALYDHFVRLARRFDEIREHESPVHG